MRILGLDFGKAKIGVAISDELGLTARPLKTIKRSSWETDLSQLRKIIKEYNVEKFVVGMPLNMSGTRGPAAEQVDRFVKRLEQEFNLPAVTQDERLSTVQAEELLISKGMRREKRKQVIDSLAAAIILQDYLDVIYRTRSKGSS